jgi:hypothetical protein
MTTLPTDNPETLPAAKQITFRLGGECNGAQGAPRLAGQAPLGVRGARQQTYRP